MGSLEGHRWEYLHQVERPFFTPDAVLGYLPAIEEQTTLHFRRLLEQVEVEPEVAVLEVWAGLFARTVLAVLFGHHDEAPLERTGMRSSPGGTSSPGAPSWDGSTESTGARKGTSDPWAPMPPG